MPRHRTRGLLGVVVALLGIVANAQDKPVQSRQIRANGVDLHYVDEGRGTPVVFVHGAVNDQRYWEPQRGPFAKQHRFIATTLRYHGTAPWPDDGRQYSAETHVADLAALIGALKAGPAHVVGLSYGGLLAAMLAVKEPKLVRTLTLAEPALFALLAESPDGKPILDEWNKGAESMMAAMKAGDNMLATARLATVVTGTPFEKMPPSMRELLKDNARTLPLLFAGQQPLVNCEMLRAVKVPTLVVRGEHTPRMFAKINESVGRCIAGSRLVVIPKASHAMSFDNPADFNRTILAFLAKH